MIKAQTVGFILALTGCSAASYYAGYMRGTEDGARLTIHSMANDILYQMKKHKIILEAFNQDRLDLAKEGIELLVASDNKHRDKITCLTTNKSGELCKK